MSKSFKFISSALLIVFGIYVSSNMAAAYIELRREFFEASMLKDLNLDVNTVHLTATKTGENLEYGSLANLMTFTIEADNPYTLRYLTIEHSATGMNLKNWKIFRSDDFSVSVGKAVDSKDNFLRFKMYSSLDESVAFLGQKGLSKFTVVANVSDDGIQNENNLEIFLTGSNDVPENFDWAWLPGTYKKSWGTTTLKYGANLIEIL